MRQKVLSFILAFLVLPLSITPAVAAIDLQADLNRIVVGIKKFDANSAATSSVSTMTEARVIFSNNTSILNEIKNANSAFKRDLNSAKKYIPSRDTKETPAFGTLMNLTKGYDEWLKYQSMNQVSAEKCIKISGSSYKSFSGCLFSVLGKTMENERRSKLKLENAWSAWKQWQVKYGYA